MKNKKSYNIRVQLALFLFTIFAASVLVKPLHIFAHHHDELHESVCLNFKQQVVSAKHHENCPICEFEFCQFIPQQNTSISHAICYFFNKQTAHSVSCIINQPSYYFRLRAPPVL